MGVASGHRHFFPPQRSNKNELDQRVIALNTSELWPSQGFNLAAILVQNA